ncbi:GTP-binding protein [Emiliania huxleyi CCMP1516]|uniref:EngB-type G domain-containing protein n=2 Tax=Emiliania huxleyi TaxID=2903 RepID=A0A0D3JI09_EMIH1|nr:GTP-binding protein [Emiliania huxleyi CCMP1516]EOD23144.1 GTP-binding protein [Emiliania huxleyi CCMP1516]|eukprot:XP_005775573.1 GTP-binding protein [Emiliania huxleyi CCMP1516]
MLRTALALRPQLPRRLRGSHAEALVTELEELKRRAKRRSERADSLSEQMREERVMHALRIANCEGPDPAVLREIETLKLGRRKHWHDQKRASQLKARVARRHAFEAQEVGKTGGLALEDLDKGNRNGRPEVALLGHSNCGKSALLNALIGAKARRGPAEVDSRAGWTMRLHFYWARPRGLLDEAHAGSQQGLVLVDTPGYGHAVAGAKELRHWRDLIEAYVSSSPSLRLALLLVDCSRGLCAADGRVLRLLRKRRVPTFAVLTKCDLLPPAELARSHAIVSAQVDEALRNGAAPSRADAAPAVPLLMLSSHFYSGIDGLWERLGETLHRQEAERLARLQQEAEEGEAAAAAEEGEVAAAAPVQRRRGEPGRLMVRIRRERERGESTTCDL